MPWVERVENRSSRCVPSLKPVCPSGCKQASCTESLGLCFRWLPLQCLGEAAGREPSLGGVQPPGTPGRQAIKGHPLGSSCKASARCATSRPPKATCALGPSSEACGKDSRQPVHACFRRSLPLWLGHGHQRIVPSDSKTQLLGPLPCTAPCRWQPVRNSLMALGPRGLAPRATGARSLEGSTGGSCEDPSPRCKT